VKVGEEDDGCVSVTLAVGEATGVVLLGPKTNEVAGIAEVAWEPGSG
jgi:hypothetical protein